MMNRGSLKQEELDYVRVRREVIVGFRVCSLVRY